MWRTRCSSGLALLAHSSRIGRRNRRIRSGSVPNVDAALADRNAFIDAGQVERMLDPHLGEQSLVGKFVDLQDDIGEVRGEWLGKRAIASRAIASISSAEGDGRSAAPSHAA